MHVRKWPFGSVPSPQPPLPLPFPLTLLPHPFSPPPPLPLPLTRIQFPTSLPSPQFSENLHFYNKKTIGIEKCVKNLLSKENGLCE